MAKQRKPSLVNHEYIFIMNAQNQAMANFLMLGLVNKHPDGEFYIQSFSVKIEEVDNETNKVTKWSRTEGYSIWCKKKSK